MSLRKRLALGLSLWRSSTFFFFFFPLSPSLSDGTLVDHEDASHAGMRELLSKVPAGAKLVYATGRSYKLYEDLKQSVDGLGDPDALICSVGTAVHTRTQGGSLEEDQDWRNHLHQGWNRAKALEVANSVGGLTAQEESEQGEFKLSYRGGFDAVQELRQGLQDAGIEAKVIFSSGRDVDILPERAGKGNAVRHLLSRWATLEGTTVDDFSSRTLVCGDSGATRLTHSSQCAPLGMEQYRAHATQGTTWRCWASRE